jgi:hypothetical protein
MPISERFWSKVNKGESIPAHAPELGPCWTWTAGTNKAGYGAFALQLEGRPYAMHCAHRVSWYLEHGIWPTLSVLHKCDNHACVRPDHLFLGTQLDNMQDMVRKGMKVATGSPGESNGNCALTEEQAREIYRRKRSGELQRVLADEYGIDQTHVSRIGRKNWLHISGGKEAHAAPGI